MKAGTLIPARISQIYIEGRHRWGDLGCGDLTVYTLRVGKDSKWEATWGGQLSKGRP